MPRLFTGIPIPEEHRARIGLMGGGIPGARWEAADKLHVTSIFIGDVDGGRVRRIRAALDALTTEAFECRLQGCGVFPPRGKPRILWLGVDDDAPLRDLHAEVDERLSALGVETPSRRYTPHLTVARLQDPPLDRLGPWMADHALMDFPSFAVENLLLYSSILAASGSKYRIEAAFPLA